MITKMQSNSLHTHNNYKWCSHGVFSLFVSLSVSVSCFYVGRGTCLGPAAAYIPKTSPIISEWVEAQTKMSSCCFNAQLSGKLGRCWLKSCPVTSCLFTTASHVCERWQQPPFICPAWSLSTGRLNCPTGLDGVSGLWSDLKGVNWFLCYGQC